MRVTCPNALGTLYLIPKLKEFLRLYPEITVELRVSDAFVDLHENDIDVAIRVGEPRGDRLIAKKVCDLKRVAVGAASYFQDHAMPRKPQDLQNHACVIVGRTHGTDEWPYVTPGGARSSIEVFGRVVVDNYLALRTAVEAGLGIGLAAGFIYDGEGLDSGGLCVSCRNTNSGRSRCISCSRMPGSFRRGSACSSTSCTPISSASPGPRPERTKNQKKLLCRGTIAAVDALCRLSEAFQRRNPLES